MFRIEVLKYRYAKTNENQIYIKNSADDLSEIVEHIVPSNSWRSRVVVGVDECRGEQEIKIIGKTWT